MMPRSAPGRYGQMEEPRTRRQSPLRARAIAPTIRRYRLIGVGEREMVLPNSPIAPSGCSTRIRRPRRTRASNSSRTSTTPYANTDDPGSAWPEDRRPARGETRKDLALAMSPVRRTSRKCIRGICGVLPDGFLHLDLQGCCSHRFTVATMMSLTNSGAKRP